MKKVMKEKLQCPYTVDDLLTSSSFIRFCRDNTTRTDNQELKFLEEKNLMLPCIKVHRGFIEYVKFKDESEKWVLVPKQTLEDLKQQKPQDRDKRGAYLLTAEKDTEKYYGLGGLLANTITSLSKRPRKVLQMLSLKSVSIFVPTKITIWLLAQS